MPQKMVKQLTLAGVRCVGLGPESKMIDGNPIHAEYVEMSAYSSCWEDGAESQSVTAVARE